MAKHKAGRRSHEMAFTAQPYGCTETDYSHWTQTIEGRHTKQLIANR
jgi:hypothetical protein